MKKFTLNFFIACYIFSTSLIGLEPPKPIHGYPNLISKEFYFEVKDMLITIKTPLGWGIGDLSLSADNMSFFSLFPENGGYGCSISIDRYANESLAKEALKPLKSSFKNVVLCDNGFEVELKHAWYRCVTEQEYLVQMWYSLPKKNKESAKIFDALKHCMSISSIFSPKFDDENLSPEKRPALQKTRNGFVCHHPDGKLDVLFESERAIAMQTTINEDPLKLHLIHFEDIWVSGYFFVKWDQTDLTTKEPFQKHIEEMLADLKNLDSGQKKTSSITFDLTDGYGYVSGNPYNLITIAGDEFLFGFAFKSKFAFVDYDINKLVRLVKWSHD